MNQECKTASITHFDDEYHFLSNFYAHPVVFQGITYPTNEHAFQAAKTMDISEKRKILSMSTPGEAKRAGRKVNLIPLWDAIKDDIMYHICKKKFSDPVLKKMLLDTGDAELIEGNTWRDKYWGVYNGVGENKLGKILMRIRDEMRED